MLKPGVRTNGLVVLKNGTANDADVSRSLMPSEFEPIGDSHVQRSRASCRNRNGWPNVEPCGRTGVGSSPSGYKAPGVDVYGCGV